MTTRQSRQSRRARSGRQGRSSPGLRSPLQTAPGGQAWRLSWARRWEGYPGLSGGLLLEGDTPLLLRPRKQTYRLLLQGADSQTLPAH